MIIACTAPVSGQTGTTSNMLAISTMMALNHNQKILILNTQRSILEQSLGKFLEQDVFKETSGGMEGIDRLVSCGLMQSDSVKNNAMSIVRDRLDVITRSTPISDENMKRNISHIFDYYKKSYDLLFIDLSAYKDDSLSKMIIEKSDLVIMNLNQNIQMLNDYKKTSLWKDIFSNNEMIYIIGQYDQRLKLNKDRVVRECQLPSKRISIVPYASSFKDAQNEQNIINYILKIRTLKTKFLEFDEDTYFSTSVKHAVSLLLNTLEVNAVMEEELYA